MAIQMKPVGDDVIKSAGPPLVSINVSFGPAFTTDKLTNRQFISRLRDEAGKHKKGFLSAMMGHFADHIEAAIAAGALAAEEEADREPNTQYYGQGSCTGCPGDDGTGADCCLCSYNDVNTGCENCN